MREKEWLSWFSQEGDGEGDSGKRQKKPEAKKRLESEKDSESGKDSESAKDLESPKDLESAKDSERTLAKEEYLAEMRARGEEEVRRKMERSAADWIRESRALEIAYPGFKLENECRDPRFLQLLEIGMDMKSAFEALHHKEILASAVRYAAESVTRKLVDSLQSRQGRMLENGVSGRSSGVVRPDVKRMTRKDREEVERRALHGERITF